MEQFAFFNSNFVDFLSPSSPLPQLLRRGWKLGMVKVWNWFWKLTTSFHSSLLVSKLKKLVQKLKNSNINIFSICYVNYWTFGRGFTLFKKNCCWLVTWNGRVFEHFHHVDVIFYYLLKYILSNFRNIHGSITKLNKKKLATL